jgi:hypothetical protein
MRIFYIFVLIAIVIAKEQETEISEKSEISSDDSAPDSESSDSKSPEIKSDENEEIPKIDSPDKSEDNEPAIEKVYEELEVIDELPEKIFEPENSDENYPPEPKDLSEHFIPTAPPSDKLFDSENQSSVPILIALIFIVMFVFIGFNNRRKLIGYVVEGARSSAQKRRSYQYSRLNA